MARRLWNNRSPEILLNRARPSPPNSRGDTHQVSTNSTSGLLMNDPPPINGDSAHARKNGDNTRPHGSLAISSSTFGDPSPVTWSYPGPQLNAPLLPDAMS